MKQNKNRLSKINIIILLLIGFLSFNSCQNSTNDKTTSKNKTTTKKEVTIYWQPYDNFTNDEILSMQKDFINKFQPLVKVKISYKILPSKKLTPNLLNKYKTRYSADNILKNETARNGIVIGLTHKDISKPLHGSSDFGILGLSFSNKNVCIVSDHRISNKHDLWKVTSHEFIHAYYDYGHCPKDNPECIIKDAKGKENLGKKHYLCEVCSNNLNK